MNEYVKQIYLEFNADKRSLQKVQDEVSRVKKLNLLDEASAEKLQEQLSTKMLSEASLKQLKALQDSFSALGSDEGRKAAENLQDAVNALEESLGIDKESTTDEKFTSPLKDIFSNFKQELPQRIDRIADKFVAQLKSLLKNSIKELEVMLKASKLSNRDTRELAFTYGFNPSQVYGFQQASQMTGLTSYEDFVYADKGEKSRFLTAFTKYADRYNELADSGFFEEMEQYQFEMQMFQQDLKLDMVKFFMDNKQLIMNSMKAIIEISKITLKIFGAIVNLFGQSEQTASSADIANQYNTTTSKNTNIKFYNNFNNVSRNDETWLQNAGASAYAQLCDALGG